MPNRVLRNWVNSDKVNALTVQAERFFTRLIMTVDDYGRFYADQRLLKANCFPLLLDTIREADISRWMAECQKAGLIVLYESNGKRYLQIEDFRQRLDRAREKYPAPLPENVLREVGNEIPPESETNPNPKQNPKTNPESEFAASAAFDAFLLSFNSITGRAFKGGKKERGFLRARLADGYNLEQIARAVSNCFNDSYHREHPNYLTPEFILRPDKLEKYLNYIIPINNGTTSSQAGKAYPKGAAASAANGDQFTAINNGTFNYNTPI